MPGPMRTIAAGGCTPGATSAEPATLSRRSAVRRGGRLGPVRLGAARAAARATSASWWSTTPGPRTWPPTGTSTRRSLRRSGCGPATRPCTRHRRRPPRRPARAIVVIHYRRPDGDYAGWGLHGWEGTRAQTGLAAPAQPGRLRRVRGGVPGAGPAGRRRPAVRAAPRRHQGPARRPAPRPDRRPARCGCWPARVAPIRPDLRLARPRARPGPRRSRSSSTAPRSALPARFADLAASFTLVAAAGGGLRRRRRRADRRAHHAAADPAARRAVPGAEPPLPAPAGLSRVRGPRAGRRRPGLPAARPVAGGRPGRRRPGHGGDRRAAARRARRPLRRGRRRRAGPRHDRRPAAAGGLGADRPHGPARAVPRPRRRAQGAADGPRRVRPASGRSAASASGWAATTATGSRCGTRPPSGSSPPASPTPTRRPLAVDSTHSLLVDLADPGAGAARLGRRWPSRPRWPRPGCRSPRCRSASSPSSTTRSPPAPSAAPTWPSPAPDAAGMRHLRSLADAGLTHVHLLPAFDFATVPDRRADQAVPACDLAALPPDSPEQQRAVMAVADADGFNWGYDPWHYTTPEGSFAVEPDGAARILEFRRMVAALNAAGLRVVMDVVYNHTMADGLAQVQRARPDRARLLPPAARRRHRRRVHLLLQHRARAPDDGPAGGRLGRHLGPGVQGGRFPLRPDGPPPAGQHPRGPGGARPPAAEVDGVEGRDIYLYGEGWNFGEVAYDARFAQATQVNMAGTGIGTFNDRLRDAVRGGGSFGDDPTVQRLRHRAGLAHPARGARPDQGGAVRRPVDVPVRHPHRRRARAARRSTTTAHPAATRSRRARRSTTSTPTTTRSSTTRWRSSCRRATAPVDRARMQVLALSLVVLSQGVGFVALGSERLRSKSLDRNSYNSGDWFNQIRWDGARATASALGLPPAPRQRGQVAAGPGRCWPIPPWCRRPR